MAIEATVILDSGVFLWGVEEGSRVEIGYFQSRKAAPQFRLTVDGEVVPSTAHLTVERSSLLEVRHVKADGSIKRIGARPSPTFNDELLHLQQLYSEAIEIDLADFDFVIRFDSGHFRGSLLKPRRFKEYAQQANGKYAYTLATGVKITSKPITHDVFVEFKLRPGEALELARDQETIWSSRYTSVKDRLELEIIADNTTAEKFYRLGLKDQRNSYWLPNEGDPPPFAGFAGGFGLPGVPLTPDPIYECPDRDYQRPVGFYNRRNPPRCPNHNKILLRKK